MDVTSPGGAAESWRIGLTVLHLAALASLAFVLRAWAQPERRTLVRHCLVAILVVVVGYLIAVRPSDIPIDWITIIHEGQGFKSVLQLYVRATHAGENFRFIVASVAAGAGPDLHDVVWMNLLLALVNAVIFFHVARYVTSLAWAVVWTLVFALNPATFLAAFSELPTNLLALYFLAGAVAWAVWHDEPAHSRAVRTAAIALVALLTLLTWLTREEVAFIGVVALAGEAVAAFTATEWRSRAMRALGAGGERILVFLSDHPGVVALLGLGSWYLTQAGLPWGLAGRSESAALYPFNPSFFSFFIFFPMLLLPLGVGVGVLLGYVHSIVHFRRFGGLALSLFLLVRMYFAAQDQYQETGRYFSYIFPAAFLLGLFGWHQLALMARAWRPNWHRAARVGYVLAWFTRPLPGAPDFYLRPEYEQPFTFSQILLDRNTQREIRHLLRVTETNPECVFVGRVVENYMTPDRPPEYAYAIFGVPVPEPLFVSEKKAALADVIARHASGTGCVRLYRGGDCNLTYTDGCTQFTAGRRVIEEERFWSRIYNNPFDYGYASTEVVLATYAWP